VVALTTARCSVSHLHGETVKVRYSVTVVFRHGHDNSSKIAGLLDMMRYENARIVSWDHERGDGAELWTVHLEADRMTVDRWSSFGLYPKVSAA
jgi:hypothetical protein